MKPIVTALLAYVAGYALAFSSNGGPDSSLAGPNLESSQPVVRNAPPGSNSGSITVHGGSQNVTDQLNNLEYDSVLRAVGGKYGNFYIMFENDIGNLHGFITGYISPNGEFEYQWRYT